MALTVIELVYTLAATIKHKVNGKATSLALSIVPLLMVLGLLAPFFGPALDHHFADRSAAHAHIFTGDATNDHNHSLVVTNSEHDHSSGVNGDGVSIISTSVSTAHSSLALDGTTLESLVPRPGGHLTALHVAEISLTDEQVIAPPGRPPRLG